MTVSTTDSVIEYVSGGPAFPIPYRFLQNSDIQAVLVRPDGTSETLVLGSQYTLSGAGAQNGGTLTSAYAASILVIGGATLSISRAMTPVQPTDLRNQGRFLAETHETVFDRLTMLIQQGLSLFRRALLRPLGKNYYDAEGRRISNLGDGAADQDAVNVRSLRSYVDAAIAGVVGGFGYFLQAGVGAVQRTFQSKMRDLMVVQDFGGIGDGLYHPLSERFGSLAEAQFFYSTVPITSLAQSIDWAATYAALWAGYTQKRRVGQGGGDFVLTDGLVVPAGANWYGEGAGQWLAWTPAFQKVLCPTQLRFIGTGPKIYSLPLVTDNRTSGGVRVNPSPLDANDGFYRLNSFMNDDGTPRMFSCAVKTARSGRGIKIKDMRIVPDYNGIAGYNDTVSTALGADWDGGFWNESGQNLILDNVHVVGHWRMFGEMQTAVIDNVDETSGNGLTGSEYSRYINCNFQGYKGVSVRGGDTYAIKAVGANYVEIEDAPNLPYKLITSGRVKMGGSETSATNFTYTAVAVVGGNLRLTITESVAGISVGNVLIANIYGFGISNTMYQNCEVSGLCHPTGLRATELGFTAPSACFEGSGSYLRGLSTLGSKFIGHEDVMMHLHNIADLTMPDQSVWEAKPSKNFATGARVIASPTPSVNTWASSPMGQTDGLLVDFGTSATNPAVDLRPYTSLAAPARFNSGAPTEIGLFNPQSVILERLQYPASRNNNISRAPNGGSNIMQDSTGTSRVVVSSTTLDLRDGTGVTRVTVSQNGSVTTVNGGGTTVQTANNVFRPGADGTTNLGQLSQRWLQVFATNGTINVSDERLKREIEAIIDQVLDAWETVGWVQFKRNDGDRKHVGLIAQRIEDAFRAANLDPFEFSLLCHEVWGPQPAVYDADGELVSEAIPGGDSYGVRYEEALVMEAALNRRTMQRFEQRLAALEAR